MASGGDYPKLAMALAAGEHLESRIGEFEEKLCMSRFFSQVILKEQEDGTLVAVDRKVPATLGS